MGYLTHGQAQPLATLSRIVLMQPFHGVPISTVPILDENSVVCTVQSVTRQVLCDAHGPHITR